MPSGPQKYPGADAGSQWFQDNFASDVFEMNVLCLHSTECTDWPGYSGGAVAPNLTGRPDFAKRQLRWRQHFDIDRSSRALVNLTGGVETNTLNVCQVELIGTCDPATAARWKRQGLVQDRDFIFWPQAPQWALDGVSQLIAWLHLNHGLQFHSADEWLPYPDSYGRTSQRLTNAQWTGFYGVLAHALVPENVHGDIGNFPIGRVMHQAMLAVAATTTKPPAQLPKAGQANPPIKAHPVVVDLSNVVAAAHHDGPAAGQPAPYRGDVRPVELALVAERLLDKGLADGSYGTSTITAYANWQRRLGYAGKDADGYPGATSLTKLGQRHGFQVKA